jgi:regulator of sigma E protease
MIDLILTIFKFIIAIGILAFFHELGHFLVARFFKIEVEEFGFGFPMPGVPGLKLFTFQGTKFTLNWIPFGAFVRIQGETDPSIPGGFTNAKPIARISVMLGGPILNLVVGVFLFSLVFLRTGAPDSSTVQLQGVVEGSPAALAGLKPGDTIVAVNGESINSMEELSTIVKGNLGKEITIQFSRPDQAGEITAIPRENPPEGEGALGIVMTNPIVQINWFQSIPIAAQMAYEQSRQLVLLPAKLIMGEIDSSQARFVGPKGMFDIYNQVQKLDQEAAANQEASSPAVNTLWLMGTISVALGLTNLLPLPALDGGRILFILPEIIIKRRVPPQYENIIHMIGFFLLIAFMIYVTFQDILNPIVLP